MKFFAERLKAQSLRSKIEREISERNLKVNRAQLEGSVKFFAKKLLNSIFAQQKMSRSLKNGQR
jgi:hypothetical protein